VNQTARVIVHAHREQARSYRAKASGQPERPFLSIASKLARTSAAFELGHVGVVSLRLRNTGDAQALAGPGVE
jgi:hypothetical protein